jgi:oligopeptide transport system substrate-binding protein
MDNDRKQPAGLPGVLKDWSRRDFLRRFGLASGALALSGGAGALLEACGGGGGGGGNLAQNQTLRVYLSTEPGTLDPNQTQWAYEAQVIRQTFEPLLRVKLDNSDVEPAGAESYSVSSDGLTWTFKLRQGAKWSDGKPVVADDWLNGYQRILNPLLAAPYADPFFDGTIKGADKYDPKMAATDVPAFLNGLGLKAPDDHTFVITLSAPAPYFKWIVSLWLAAPVRRSISDATKLDPKTAGDWAAQPSTAVSNGWFKLSEYQQKDHITVVPNDNYWGSKPKLTKLVLPIQDDPAKAYASYQNGELEMATVPVPDSKSNANNAEVHKSPELSAWWVDFNTLQAPFDNKKLRQAFSMAIDREKLVNDVLQGHAFTLATFIPKGMKGYADQDLGQYQKYDLAKAKQLFKDSGVTAADLAKITVDYRANDEDRKNLTEFCINSWNQAFGINLQANPVDSKQLSANLKGGKYAMSVLSGWSADYPDQQDWFDIFISPTSPAARGNNFPGYSNPDYDKLVKQADSTMDESKRDSLYKQAHQMLVQDAPGAFLYQRNRWSLIKKYVKGVTINAADDYPFVGDFDTPSIYIESH